MLRDSRTVGASSPHPLHNTSDAHYSRRELLAEALLAIPASSLAGAMIQIEALSDPPLNPGQSADYWIRPRRWLRWGGHCIRITMGVMLAAGA